MIACVAEKPPKLNLGPELTVWRKRHGWSQTELASKIGTDRSTLAGYEGQRPIPYNRMVQLERLGFNVNQMPRTVAQATGRIKVMGSISAGVPMSESEWEARTILVPAQFAREDYSATNATGDSLFPYVMRGDTLIFHDTKEKTQRAPCSIQIAGEAEPRIKELAFRDGEWWMDSWNPAEPSERLPQDHTINGYLVGICDVHSTLAIGPIDRGLDKAFLEMLLRGRLI